MKTHLMFAALALAGPAAQAGPTPNHPTDGAGRPAGTHQATGASHGGRPAGTGHPGAPTPATHAGTAGKTGPWSSPTAPVSKSSSAPAGHWGTPTAPNRTGTTSATKASPAYATKAFTSNSWKAPAKTAPAPRPNYTNYHLTHGKAFSGGYCYPGRDHTHWTYHGWSKRYHCECYWCPSTRQYYYWCASADCYYPVSYYESAPCPAPEPAVCATPAPVCAPAPCPPAVEYVTYQVPCVSYRTVAVTGYKTVTVARPVAAPACCPAPCPCPTPAPAPISTPAPTPYGGDEPPADVPAVPQ